MDTLCIWLVIGFTILMVYLSYRKNKKKQFRLERLDELYNEHIQVVDEVLYELEANRRVKEKMKSIKEEGWIYAINNQS